MSEHAESDADKGVIVNVPVNTLHCLVLNWMMSLGLQWNNIWFNSSTVMTGFMILFWRKNTMKLVDVVPTHSW